MNSKEKSTTNKNNNQNKFASRLGFIAAASGAAVGLGNIWKFPYEVGENGGACFLIIYLLFTIILGYPIVLAKIAFGRSINSSVYSAYKKEGNWKLLGFAPALLCLILFSFYCVITGWILGYCFELINGNLFKQTDMGTYFVSFIKDIPKNLIYNLIIMASIAIIIRAGIQNGIERSSKILMPFFVVVLLVLIIYALTLENGVKEGIKFYLLPNFSLITKKSISSALSQSFMSLAIGSSVMITYGAYAKERLNLVKDTSIIVGSDLLVAFLAGLLIFPFIFFKGIKPNEGPSLIFITLPYVFKTLNGITGIIIGVLFFLLLVFAAITSAVPMLEISTNYLMGKWKLSRKKSVTILFFVSYALSIPTILSNGGNKFFTKFIKIKGIYYSFLSILDVIVIDYGLPLVGLFFCIFIRSRWKKYKIEEQLNPNAKYNKWFLSFIYIAVGYIGPVLISLSLLFNFI